MQLNIFSVYDTATAAYMQPFFAPTPGAAIRMFTDTVNDPNTQFHNHAGDFILFQIGEWDDHKGEVSSHTPHNLGNANEYLRKDISA